MTVNFNVLWSSLHLPNNEELVGWYVELSFMTRALTYLVILGIVFFIIVLILNYLGAWNEERDMEEFDSTTIRHVPSRFEQGESEEFIPKKMDKFTYETFEKDLEACSSDELYDEKICIICYDEQRNCFFVPCGHCATCFDCAERIIEEDSRACPICRRLIHKVQKLFHSDV